VGDPRTVPYVPSQCIIEEYGWPKPRIELLHPPPLEVPCESRGEVALVNIANDSGQGFEWWSQMQIDDGVFTPTMPQFSACPGFGFTEAGVYAQFPSGSEPGESATGTLRIVTSYAPIGVIDADVTATLIASDFTLDPTVLDFGSVLAGQVVTLHVTVHNNAAAPLEKLVPSGPQYEPFSYRDWVIHGEDTPPTVPIPPGGSQQITISFSPSTPGNFSSTLELSPFDPGVPATCGTPQTLALHGVATAL
jgi:hypothetical protein